MNNPLYKRCISRELVPAALVAFMFLTRVEALAAQTVPGAVLAKNEPHHHLAYEDSSIRVLRVRVPPHDTTLLHEHDPDYFWIALGSTTVINARVGSPDAPIASKDLSIHYSFGPFAHVARNPGDVPFDNITVELLQPQTNVRNLCEESVAAEPLACPTVARGSGGSAFFVGAPEHAALATDKVRVSLVTLAPGGVLRPMRKTGVWIIALDSADAGRVLRIEGKERWRGGTFRAQAASAWALTNRGRSPARLIAVVDLASGIEHAAKP